MGSNQPDLKKMVWVDIETSGLDSAVEIILEIGVQVTDVEGRLISEMSDLVYQEDAVFLVENGDEYVKEMHTKSGLLAELEALANAPSTPDDPKLGAEAMALKIVTWLTNLGLEAGVYPICGSTINFDRSFLYQHMRPLHDWFHYRNIDISTVKGLCAMLNPTVYAGKPEHESTHRALPDIDDTVKEYNFYVDNFLHIYLPS